MDLRDQDNTLERLPEAELLQRCPKCLYFLTGLPVEYHCPECGLAVDRRWRVFGGKLNTGYKLAVGSISQLITVLAAGYALILCTVALIALPMPNAMAPIPLFVLFASLVAWIWRKPRGFVAVGPMGLDVYRGDEFQRIPWSEVGRSRYDLLRKSLKISCSGKDLLLPAYPFFGTNIGEVDRCVQGINHYPRPREPEPEVPPQSPLHYLPTHQRE